MEQLKKRFGLVLVVCVLAMPAFAQGLGQILPMGEGVNNNTPQDGFRLYGVSVFSQYSTQALPFGAVVPTNGANLGPATTLGVGGSLGWTRYRERRQHCSVAWRKSCCRSWEPLGHADGGWRESL